MKIDSTTLHLFGEMPREMGNPSRITVYNIEQMSRFIEENNGVRDVYTSVYPLNGVIDKIFFDLDGKGALDDAKKIYKWLKEKGFCGIPIASGKKGFHLYVLLKPAKYGDETKKLLLKASLSILQSVFKDEKSYISVDPHPIGDVRRICRVPNTLRPPQNLNLCTYLPPDSFLDMTEEDVTVHIKSPHVYEYEFDGKLPTLKDFPEPEGYDLKEWKPIQNEIPIITKDGNVFLRNVLRPCLYRRLLTPEPPHHVRVAATIDLLKFFSPEEILNFYSQLGWSDWEPKTTYYQIEHCKGLKAYSCRKLRRLGVPSVCCVG